MNAAVVAGTVAATGEIRIPFDDAQVAARAAASLEPDNDGHLDARVDGATLVLQASGGGAMSLLRTFDDALACLRATGIE